MKSIEDLRQELRACIGSRSETDEDRIFAIDGQRSLELALGYARSWGNDQISASHLLAGILGYGGNSLAYQALQTQIEHPKGLIKILEDGLRKEQKDSAA